MEVDCNKNLMFPLHVRTVFYDENNNVIESLYTNSYPENVEIYVPENTKYIKTLYHRENNSFNVLECEKSDNAIRCLPQIFSRQRACKNMVIHVDDYGFKGDGTFDNSEKLLEIEELINNNFEPHKDYMYTIEFGAGVYKFKKSKLEFLSRKVGNCVWGLNIKGQGSCTQILYKPDENDADENYFIANNNSYGSIKISDISFFGNGINTSFCRQVADPFPQHITVDDVVFCDFNYTFNLKASDCNSEFSFNDCKWRGKCEAVINGVKPGISAQMLNYWFYNPDFQCYKGSLVKLEMGGNINVIGGNLIHKSTDGSHNVEGGTFFDLSGDNQQYGVCRFLCEGTRFECSDNRNSSIMRSNWGNKSSITFISIDDTAKSFSGDNFSEFEFIATKGLPEIKFIGCMIYGKHTYDLSNNNWHYAMNMNSVSYDACIFAQDMETPYDFIDIKGKECVLPPIRFNNLPKVFSSYENTCYREKSVPSCIINKKYVNIKMQRGTFPITSNNCKTTIPLNSIITGVKLYAPKGYSDGTNNNNIEIYVGNENNKTMLLKVDSRIEKDGLNININDISVFASNEDMRTITFKRESTFPGTNKEDSLIALVEFI